MNMDLTTKLQAVWFCILLVFTGTAEAALFHDEITMYLVVAFLCVSVIFSTSFVVALSLFLMKLKKVQRKNPPGMRQSTRGSANAAFSWDMYLPKQKELHANHINTLIDQAARVYIPRAKTLPGKGSGLIPMSGNESSNMKITQL